MSQKPCIEVIAGSKASTLEGKASKAVKHIVSLLHFAVHRYFCRASPGGPRASCPWGLVAASCLVGNSDGVHGVRCSTACRAACLIATVSILGCALLLCTALPFLRYVLSALCPRIATAHMFMGFEGRCYIVLLFLFVLYSKPLASWLHA